MRGRDCGVPWALRVGEVESIRTEPKPDCLEGPLNSATRLQGHSGKSDPFEGARCRGCSLLTKVDPSPHTHLRLCRRMYAHNEEARPNGVAVMTV